jgi:hypothetical protein
LPPEIEAALRSWPAPDAGCHGERAAFELAVSARLSQGDGSADD